MKNNSAHTYPGVYAEHARKVLLLVDDGLDDRVRLPPRGDEHVSAREHLASAGMSERTLSWAMRLEDCLLHYIGHSGPRTET